MNISSIILDALPSSFSLIELWGAAMPLTQTIVFLVLSAALTDYMRNRSRIVRLSDVRPPLPPQSTPPLSLGVIVPAKDEEQRVHIGLRSILRSTGLSALHVVAINDRSTDGTPRLMEEIAQEQAGKSLDPHKFSLKVIHLSELPTGWLGKTNACYTGALHLKTMSPEYLLFTDADVVFHEQALFEAALHMKRENLDFLTVFPNPEFTGPLEAAFLMFFGAALNLFSRPWMLGKPGGKAHLGIGAFLMVRADAYFKLDGHKSIKLNVAEDLKLSLLFRAAGYKCAAARAGNRVNIRWGVGLKGTLKGLVKNVYAGYDYSLFKLVGGCIGLIALFVTPWFSIYLDDFSRILGTANISMLLIVYYILAKELRIGWIMPLLLSPLMCLLLVAVSIVSALSIQYNQGVLWRDSFYPLIDLKRGVYTPRQAFKSARKNQL